MKIKSYIKKLQKLAERYPNAVLVAASDDEGNSFNEVNFGPTYFLWDSADNQVYYVDDEDKPEKLVDAIVLN